MAKQPVNSQSWYGGLATDLKRGIPNSFANSRGIDFRKKPSQFSVLPGATKASAGVVTGLIQNMVQVPDGTRYALDENGRFYKENTSGVWSVVGNVGSGAHGLVYRQDADAIYITGLTSVSRYYPISGSPVLDVDKYGNSPSTDSGATRTGGLQTYVPLTALDETSNSNRFSFTPDIEPLYSVKIKVVSKGTGDWTVVVHDDANNLLGTKTITNANLTNGELNEFIMAAPVRMLIKPNARTYHVHVTSTASDGSMQVATATNLATADYQIIAPRLISPRNGMHPAVLFQQWLCVANERYVSVFEPLSDNPSNLEWLRHRVTLPPGYEICGLAFTDEFLAIAAENRSTSSTRDFQDGKIFFWDGTATTYNFFADVPEGSPYSIYSYENIIYFQAGGALWANTGSKQNIKVRTLPNTDSEFSGIADGTVGYPNMFTTRRGIMLMGYPSTTTNRSLVHGVYSWGSVDKNYSKSFGLSYTLSTGTELQTGSNNLTIGMVKNFGDTLYISWRDGNTYGVDVVNNSSAPARFATMEMPIYDGGIAFKKKKAHMVTGTMLPLPANWTVKMKYKLDREAAWHYGTPVTTEGAVEATVSVPNQNEDFKEAQWGMDFEHDGSATQPVEVTSIMFEFDDLAKELKM